MLELYGQWFLGWSRPSGRRSLSSHWRRPVLLPLILLMGQLMQGCQLGNVKSQDEGGVKGLLCGWWRIFHGQRWRHLHKLQGEMQVAATMVEQTIESTFVQLSPLLAAVHWWSNHKVQSFPHYTSAQFGLRWLQLPKKLKEQQQFPAMLITLCLSVRSLGPWNIKFLTFISGSPRVNLLVQC